MDSNLWKKDEKFGTLLWIKELFISRIQEPDPHQIKFGFEGLVSYFPQYLFQHSLPKKNNFELRQYLFNIFNRVS